MSREPQPPTTLISAEELMIRIGQRPPPVVLDAGFDLADLAAGERSHAQAHVPGALYVHLDRDLSGTKDGRNGRHPLPDRASFAASVGSLGIGPGTQVVVYDEQGAIFASRVWWLLRWLGHEAVAVLDGGLAAWRAAGGEVTSQPSPPPSDAGPYPSARSLAKTIDADSLLHQLGRRPLIDARAPERFRGDVEPLDAQAGHIPGALNRFYRENLDAAGRFKPAAELRQAFSKLAGQAEPGTVVHQCGSGVTACHNLLAMEHAGLHGSVLYPGSWSEWSADPARPVARDC